MKPEKKPCPDCGPELPRRDFLKVAAGAAAVAAVARPSFGSALSADVTPEELVKKFYGTLTADQKKVVAFAWDHPKRLMVNNNWKIVEPHLGDFYTGDQVALIKDIFKGIVSPEGAERFSKQMKDDYQKFENYHVCIFGDPTAGKYSWVLSGRHNTMRCDGNSNDKVAFGGPIFYGHASGDFNEKADHPGNVWWPQGQQANKVFQALDGKQREKALLESSPPDTAKAIVIKGAEGPFKGIAVGEMSKDQKALVEECMKAMLAPFRASDVEEAMSFIKEGGGLDKVHLSFYKEDDIGSDGVWDRWMLEGPTMSWYFRGSPHVHTWVNIGAKA